MTKLDKTIFLVCNFSNNYLDKKKIYFSTDKKIVSKTYEVSNAGKLNISLSTFIGCDLTNCDFSYSNLWGAYFENCTLTNTKFNQAECEGVDFDNSIINDEQIKDMLFISRNKGDFAEFSKECSREYQLEHGIIYDKDPTCFKNWEEYKKFKNKKFKRVAQKERIKSKGIFIKIKKYLCQKICKNIELNANDNI